MSDIYKVNSNLPSNNKIEALNDMILINEGDIANAKFDENEITDIYSQIVADRKYLRNVDLGNTLTTYTDWTHYLAEVGYSIWQITPDSYVYNALNNLYLDGEVLTNMGQATSLAATFDKAYIYLEPESGESAYTDNTTEASTEGGTAFSLMAELTTTWATPNNELYVGLDTQFSGAKFEFAVRGGNYTLRVGYWNGSSWTEMDADTNDLSDDTSNFQSDGLITWTLPDDWAKNTLNSNNKYWIRINTSTTPTITATCNYLIPGNSVQGLLALSSSKILNEEWTWCSYNSNIYVTVRNVGSAAYEGDYYITSSSTATNLQNYYIYNHTYKIDHEDSTYDPVPVKTTDYIVTGLEGVILVNDGSGGATMTLPTAVGNEGMRILIKKIGDTANVVLDPVNGETIDGAGDVTLGTQYDFKEIVSDGSNWYIIGENA